MKWHLGLGTHSEHVISKHPLVQVDRKAEKPPVGYARSSGTGTIGGGLLAPCGPVRKSPSVSVPQCPHLNNGYNPSFLIGTDSGVLAHSKNAVNGSC